MKTLPKLTLVGAGPGDAELMTLKGIKALKSANVVLYDALVNREILEWIPPNVEALDVGKRGGMKSMTQTEINKLIVSKALSCGHVVRLKGGDPFIFGRGFEEIEYVESFGIITEIVPGISSINAVPASQKIPLTHRGMSRSFWAVTATSAEGSLSKDVELAAQSSATIVLLMGMRKLHQIMDRFSVHGKGSTPVAIIQNGTTSEEKICLGTVNDIVFKAREQKMGSPAIILVGEVVNLHENSVLKEELMAKYFL